MLQWDGQATRPTLVSLPAPRNGRELENLQEDAQMFRGKASTLLSVLLLASLALSACGPPAPVEEAEATPVLEVAHTPAPSVVATTVPPTAIPPVATSKTLVVCQALEPTSLYLYATHELAAAHVLAAIYDGPIDTITYEYRAVALEKVPNLNDDDATIRQVQVDVGDTVVDERGEPVVLASDLDKPIMLRPAGCIYSDCIVPWLPASGPLVMDQMVVTFTLKAGQVFHNVNFIISGRVAVLQN